MEILVKIETTMKPDKKRILVVDDRASDTRLVKLYLEGTNDYVVREENDAKAALSAAEEFQPHLILLDVMMPGMDGGDVAACFRENEKLKAVPIVFLTSAVTKGEVEAGGGWIGGFPFLAKPFVLSEVGACLKHHLGGRVAVLPTRHVRVRTAPIQVGIAGGFGRLMNISATGALVHVPQTLAHECLPRSNTSVTGPLVIYVKPDAVELRVRVVRSTAVSVRLPGATVMKSEECDVALAFTDLLPAAQVEVKRLCGQAFEQQE